MYNRKESIRNILDS